MRKYIISGRHLQHIGYVNDKAYVNYCLMYYQLDMSQVDSVFGFYDHFLPLYGGRAWQSKDTGLSLTKIKALNSYGIGFGLAISGSFFTEDAYSQSIDTILMLMDLSDKNYLIISNDQLALRIKENYPHIRTKYSAISDVEDVEGVIGALFLYDEIALHIDKNYNHELLMSIPEDIKDRVIVFGNGTCAAHCRNKICYVNISRRHLGLSTANYGCIKGLDRANGKPVPGNEYYEFDLTHERFDGFNTIKLIKPLTGIIKE